ncbi:MAG: hypothetical protein GX580_03220 [Candidatus Hydrogenedens sp.]|nr:hypothetical protein [Candidatus Hydrogenedens sp.]
MEGKDDPEKLRKRYERLEARLARPGPIIQGTITARTITREDPRHPGKTRTLGPYYQWTFKRSAKTVTVNLSAQQAKRFQKAIDNNRRIEEVLEKMRELSVEILNATTTGVARRNRSK